MEVVTTGKNAKKKKFQLTSQLIRLALNDGWTQEKIAITCRTQQPVVSGWKNGTAKATESQLKPLLDIYGYQLRRNAFRVYWSLNPNTSESVFHRVEGRVILSQSFSDPRRQNYKLVKKIPQYRIVVHDQGRTQFRVVEQSRLKFERNEELECSHEDAIWHSRVGERMGVDELIRFIDEFCKVKLKNYPSDAVTLPFLIRKALLNHGHNVHDVEDYPAVW